MRNQIFVSYAHADAEWLDRLRRHLTPYLRRETLTLWEDTRIRPGADWSAEIDEALANARVAVLLVTANFLASDFIHERELPMIVEKARDNFSLIWVPVSTSAWGVTPLAQFQAAISPDVPLDTMSGPDQEAHLADIARKIADAANMNVVGNTFKTIDSFASDLEAFLRDDPLPETPREFGARVVQTGQELQLQYGGDRSEPLMTLKDISSLDTRNQVMIRAYEQTMDELHLQWSEQKPRTVSTNSVIRDRARAEMERVKTQLCKELDEVLGFIESLGYALDDHYQHVRFLCQA